jgi:hypothetical protein
VDSPYFDSRSDPFRNLIVSEIDPHATHLLEAIKAHVDGFFAKRYEHYRTFVERLRVDDSYPYKERKSSSQSRTLVFNQLAYFVETEHRLLTERNKIRRLVYDLMDRALNSRHFEELLTHAINLDEQTVIRFRALLDKADLEDVIAFTDEVADKGQFLDFLHALVYGAPAKHLKERSQLHKIVQRHLWLFGENYNGAPILFSDKGLEGNLAALRERFFNYEPAGAGCRGPQRGADSDANGAGDEVASDPNPANPKPQGLTAAIWALSPGMGARTTALRPHCKQY